MLTRVPHVCSFAVELHCPAVLGNESALFYYFFFLKRRFLKKIYIFSRNDWAWEPKADFWRKYYETDLHVPSFGLFMGFVDDSKCRLLLAVSYVGLMCITPDKTVQPLPNPIPQLLIQTFMNSCMSFFKISTVLKRLALVILLSLFSSLWLDREERLDHF